MIPRQDGPARHAGGLAHTLDATVPRRRSFYRRKQSPLTLVKQRFEHLMPGHNPCICFHSPSLHRSATYLNRICCNALVVPDKHPLSDICNTKTISAVYTPGNAVAR